MYNANYMDGVPVKIAEKYKPPPVVYKLPQSLLNKLNNIFWDGPALTYDSELNHKALSKIEQWKRIRQRNKELRRERISKRELQRKREDEDRQKNLLYNVSYPSTDDLSSEEENENGDEKVKQNENVKAIADLKNTSQQICITKTANCFHNILQPTVLSFNNSSSNNINNSLSPTFKPAFECKVTSSFNYKDFEDDTSSPFDNIELKTINDLDVLAQVLHNTQLKPVADGKHSDNAEIYSNNLNEASNKYKTEQQHFHSKLLFSQENEDIPKSKISLPDFDHDPNSAEKALHQIGDHQTTSAHKIQYYTNLPPPVLPHDQQLQNCNESNESHYRGLNNFLLNNCYNKDAFPVDKYQPKYDRIQTLTNDQMSKSKSVPDIVKELRDEIRNSEMRRHRNCSYNKEESTHNVGVCLTTKTVTRINDAAENNYIENELDSNGQQLVRQISAMGFPQQRVAKVVQLLGADGKKVIEHLIPLSELADLGFDETKISEALISNKNNKNKALDDLIS